MLFASPRDDVPCQTHGEGAKSKPRPVLEKRRRPTCQSTRCSRLEPDGRKSRSLSRNRTLRNNALVAGSGTINEADIAEVKSLALDAATRTGKVAGDEAPEFWVREMQRDGVCCVVAAWAATATDAWALRSGVRERLLGDFRERGIATMLSRHAVARETI